MGKKPPRREFCPKCGAAVYGSAEEAEANMDAHIKAEHKPTRKPRK